MEVGEGIGDAPGGGSGGAGGSTSDPSKVVTIQIVAEIPEGGPPTGLAGRVKESRDWAKTMVGMEFRSANQRLGHPVRADPSTPLEVVRGQTTKVKISAARVSVNATSGSMVLNPDLGSLNGQFDD